jgi:hypothetical protein
MIYLKKNLELMHAFLGFFFLFLNLIFILVDAAAVDNNSRISPENNLDFYAYSQATPYSVNSYFDIY